MKMGARGDWHFQVAMFLILGHTRFQKSLLPGKIHSEKQLPPNKRFKPTRTSGGVSACEDSGLG